MHSTEIALSDTRDEPMMTQEEAQRTHRMIIRLDETRRVLVCAMCLRQGWRQLGFQYFEHYCEKALGIQGGTGYDWTNQVRVSLSVHGLTLSDVLGSDGSPNKRFSLIPSSISRILHRLKAVHLQRDLWNEAVESIPQGKGFRHQAVLFLSDRVNQILLPKPQESMKPVTVEGVRITSTDVKDFLHPADIDTHRVNPVSVYDPPIPKVHQESVRILPPAAPEARTFNFCGARWTKNESVLSVTIQTPYGYGIVEVPYAAIFESDVCRSPR